MLQLWNKAKVPTNAEPWNLIADLRTMTESLQPVVPVADAAERDGLAAQAPNGVLPAGLVVNRLDLGGMLESWDGTRWVNPQTGAPRTMWRRIQGDAIQLISANEWRTLTRWADSDGAPGTGLSGIPHSSGVITIPRTGRWRMHLQAAIEVTASVATGRRMSVALVPSLSPSVEAGSATSPYASASVSTTFMLTEGETVAAQFRHTDGTAKNTYVDSGMQFWEMEYLGPGV